MPIGSLQTMAFLWLRGSESAPACRNGGTPWVGLRGFPSSQAQKRVPGPSNSPQTRVMFLAASAWASLRVVPTPCACLLLEDTHKSPFAGKPKRKPLLLGPPCFKGTSMGPWPLNHFEEERILLADTFDISARNCRMYLLPLTERNLFVCSLFGFKGSLTLLRTHYVLIFPLGRRSNGEVFVFVSVAGVPTIRRTNSISYYRLENMVESNTFGWYLKAKSNHRVSCGAG